MALTATLPKTILSFVGSVNITAAEDLEAGDLITADGYKADADNSRNADLIALTSVPSGSTVKATPMAIVEGLSGGAGAGTRLFLSDTAGDPAESAGTVGQTVGVELSETSALLFPQYSFSQHFLGDGQSFTFGNGSDITLGFDGTQLELLPATDDTGAFNIGDGTTDMDFKVFLGSTSIYALFDKGNALLELAGGVGLTISGNPAVALNITGTPTKVLAAGSYASPMTHSNSELITIAATDTTGFIVGFGSYMKATGEDGYPFGIATLVESTHTTGTKTLQGIQAMAFLGTVGGSEAAHLKTLGGDAVAGMYAAWFKVGANSNCVCDSGSRVAAVWLDNQLSGTVSGEEYAAFITCGASKVDAVFGLETTSSGWTYLFDFDETAYDQDPVVASGCNVSGAGADEAYLKVNLNGTLYGLPLIAI